jgi:octopine/nopaline transport system permease protein
MMDVGFMVDTMSQLARGVPLTLQLAATSVSLGFIPALCLALALETGRCPIVWPIRGYVAAFRGTPLLVQIFLIYYGLGQFRPTLQLLGLWSFFRAPFWCAILALSLNTAAYGTEIIRGGLQSVPYGQIEAARACGMSRSLAYRRVILPIALRQALPSYGNEIILMIKRHVPDLDHHPARNHRHRRADHLADLPGGRGIHVRGRALPRDELSGRAGCGEPRTLAFAAS